MKIAACTIVAQNYLAHARVLADSFLDAMPEASFVIVQLDGPQEVPHRDRCTVVTPFEIGIDASEVHRMLTIYDVQEFATSVKPWALETLLDDGAEAAFYLDPDIDVHRSLHDVAVKAVQHGIVVTPHALSPMPRDGHMPSEQDILRAGVYNLGFLCVSQAARPFLMWWQQRLRRDCICKPESGYFVDQRWVDFAPGMFDVHILREPEWNVAYWNLSARRFSGEAGSYLVDDRPLGFFHFSGYGPHSPHLLSKHQGPSPRVLLSDNAALLALCTSYRERLLGHGFDDASVRSFEWACLPDGTPLDVRMRRAYRAALMASEAGAPEPPDPFTETTAFLAWLAESDDGVVSRYLREAWNDQPHLQAIFLDIETNPARFIGWAKTSGRASIPKKLRRSVCRLPGKRPFDINFAAPTDIRPGVAIAGYFRAELGVGEAARCLLRGIETSGERHATFTYSDTMSRQQHAHKDASRLHDYDVNIVCVNADMLPSFARDASSSFFQNRYTIGLWFWEASEFPDRNVPAFDYVDEVWVSSEFVAKAIRAKSSKPVHVAPLAIATPAVEELDREALGLPEAFTYLFSYDMLSIVERKNPLGLIDAFCEAFAPGEGPILVLKSINGDKRLQDLERVRFAARNRPDIFVIDGYLTSSQKNGLMAACDCYVSLHRSEGYGLTMAEAMALAKPVIATGFSGNLAFMDEHVARLVTFKKTRVPQGCDPYPPGAIWASPDTAHAAACMREIWLDPESARALGERGREAIADRASAKRCAEFITSRLDEIRMTDNKHSNAKRAGLEVDARTNVIAPHTPWNATSRFGKFGGLYRRLLRMALRPILVRHEEQTQAMIREIASAQADINELADELQRVTGELEQAVPAETPQTTQVR